MTTTTTSSRTAAVQWLIESRPPSLTWSRSWPRHSNQPPLDLTDQEVSDAAVAALDNRGVRMSLVTGGWAATQRPDLPDARQWSTTLALALIQALLGQRPVAQLNRWAADEVLAAISMCQRRNLPLRGRIAIPAAVRSVRVQHPEPGVAEVAAHVAIGKRSAAIAFRLEALGDRWLCTALELGARWRRVVDSG
jgi:Family of unknown function (DUF6459)